MNVIGEGMLATFCYRRTRQRQLQWTKLWAALRQTMMELSWMTRKA